MLRFPGFFFLLPLLCAAQEPRRDTIVVTGTYAPLALDEVDRTVVSLPAREQSLVLNHAVDLLQLDPSLDLRQRAPGGVQGDLSIRGSSFGQTLILLNGLRINDAQTGHHNLDIPVPLEAIERIEVLRGTGSTLYGSDAVGGVVNIITRPPEASEFRLRGAAGNLGAQQERGSFSFVRGRLAEQLVFSRDFSSGFRPDRDFRTTELSSTTHWDGSDLTVGWRDNPFGADQFYGNYPSWERTRTWFASARHAFGERTEAALSFRRHTDLFVLDRDHPSLFTNRHAVESWQASLRRNETLGRNVSFHYGAEGYRDAIRSSNLGDHSRQRGAGYAALDVRALHRFSFGLSTREEVYSHLSGQFSPTASGGVWLSPNLKLRASASRAFRLPTYTDLYYQDPANQGSPDLRPERAWGYEGGVDWSAGRVASAGVTVFNRRERDGIDYVRRSPTDIWRAMNIQRLNFTGVEAELRLPHRLEFRYTGLRGGQDATAGLLSKYVFNYPTHSGVVAWMASLPGGILVRTRAGVLDRRARDPYALWDVYVASSRGRLHPFLQLANITATKYQEIPGVAMPGRTVLGGIEMVVGGK